MTVATPVKFKLGSIILCSLALVTGCAHRPNEISGRNAALTAHDNMRAEEHRTKSDTEIHELIDGFVKAIRAKDMNGIMSVFAPEVVSFDFGPPLQHGGGHDFEKRWQELFESYQGPIQYEVQELNITASDAVAFTRSLNWISGTLKNGNKRDRWLRWTASYRKTNGKWLIVHEHVSVPVDVKEGKALLDLKP